MTKLEKEFKDEFEKIHPQIEEHIKAAHFHLMEARKISDQHGIPFNLNDRDDVIRGFLSGYEDWRTVYVPHTFKKYYAKHIKNFWELTEKGWNLNDKNKYLDDYKYDYWVPSQEC